MQISLNLSKAACLPSPWRGPLAMKKYNGSPQGEGRHDHIGIKVKSRLRGVLALAHPKIKYDKYERND